MFGWLAAKFVMWLATCYQCYHDFADLIGGPVDPGIIDVQTSESEQRGSWEDLKDESSVHESSSDPPVSVSVSVFRVNNVNII